MSRLKGDVRLFCRDCGKEMMISRESDPALPNCVKTISSRCPECCGGDYGEEIWLDAVGREVDWETGKPRHADVSN